MLHGLPAPKFTDNKQQVLSVGLSKLRDDTGAPSRADTAREHCGETDLGSLAGHQSLIRERFR
jgi:hypothetical protein